MSHPELTSKDRGTGEPGAGPPDGSMAGWVGQRHKQLLLLLLVFAAVLRLIAFFELSDSPAVSLNAFEDSDMAFFNAWSQQLARGQDILSDGALSHPLHSWHREVANEHLSVHPEELGGRNWDDLSDREQLSREGLLWYEWYGRKTFHQEPVYPYLMGLLYGLFPGSIRLIQVLQMVLGVALIGLVYRVARIYFGIPVAMVTAVLLTLYGPLLHYEFFLLRTTLICFGGMLLIFLAERYRAEPSPSRWIGYGMCCGLAAGFKISFALFGLIMCAYMLWPQRHQRGVTARGFGLWALGVLLALLPIFGRNLVVGAPMFGITSIGPVTFAVANHAEYVANSGWSVNPTVIAKIMGESGGALLSTVGATLATHDGVGSYLGLLWAKFCQIWQWLEVPNNTNVYMVAKSSAVLSRLPVTFTLLASLGLVGLGAAYRLKRHAFPLLMLMVLAMVQMTGFYVLGRFRLPMMVALAPFSALGLISLWQWFRGGRLHLAVGGLALAIGFAMWIERDLYPERRVINVGDYDLAYRRFYRPGWQAAASAGDWPRAEDLMRRAIAIRPEFLDDIKLPINRIRQGELQAAEVYVEAYGRYALSLQNLGRTQEAQKAQDRADVLSTIIRSVVRGQGR